MMCNTPDDILSLSDNLPYRDYILVGLELNNINLKDENGNLTNDNWIYIQDERVKAGRMQIMNNWSPYLVRDKNKFTITGEWEDKDEVTFKEAKFKKLLTSRETRRGKYAKQENSRVKD